MNSPVSGEQKDQKAEQDRLLHRSNDLSGSALAGGGLLFGGAIVVSALAGSWLDRRFGSGPWLLLLTVLVGSTLGFWGMYRTMNRGISGDSKHR